MWREVAGEAGGCEAGGKHPTSHGTVCSVQFSVYSFQSALYSVEYIVCSVQFAVYSVQCAQLNVEYSACRQEAASPGEITQPLIGTATFALSQVVNQEN